MARIPDLKRIVKEDYPSEFRPLIERLAFPLNSHMEQVRSAFNKNINFENLAQELKTINFTTGDNGQPITAVSFRSDINTRIQGIIPVRVIITSNNTAFATQLPIISWTQENNIVSIQNIGGLSPRTGYSLTLLTL